MNPIHFTRRAVADLNEIYDFIAQDSPSTAISFIDLLEDECKVLAQSPKIGRLREELAQNLRSFSVGNYVIFYRPVERGIEIIRILHSARDIPNIFLE